MLMQAIEPSEAKGRGFDPRQPHHIFRFLTTPLFSGLFRGLELDSLDRAKNYQQFANV
jgi:hypothetical protein